MPARGDLRKFKNADLVLSVDPNVSPAVWNEGKYEAFIEELCGIREFQKDAIRTALRYWLGGKCSNLKTLAKENFDSKDELQQRYGTWSGMEKQLQFPEQLACSLDLATATGKSYVLYGLAAILLAEGIVESVLVLCPSNTIEAGLTEKFRELAGNANLRALLPAGAKVTSPRIINASQTIVPGAICVENYHAILAHVKSSIRDSLKGRGAKVAVFNDEAHHIASDITTNAKRWKEFLLSADYGFRILLGVSGTCYVGDDYFSDVVFRYSLRKAIEEHFAKKIEYVAEAPQTDSPDEKWQLVYNRHQAWKKKLKPRNIRPLTIVVTRDIDLCKRTADDLVNFLAEWEKIPVAKAAEKVLVVTSDPKHQANVAQLKMVDSPASKVEWIVSVAMLNEGWDVKNVFQIVPHEEKAFNSKLLIGQVLGRGLRRPEPWIGEDPTVTVFNHDAWSGRIRHLVNEVLEIERRITSSILAGSSLNFDLHTLDYSRSEKADEMTEKGDNSPLKRGYVELPTQVETEEVVIDFTQATNNDHNKFKTQLSHKTYSIDEVAETMFRRLESIDEESKDEKNPKDRTNYASQFPVGKCTEIITESLKRASIQSSRITEDNRQKFLGELGALRKKRAKRVVFTLKSKTLIKLNTKDRRSDSCSAAELRRRDKTIFYGPNCSANLPEEQVEFLKEIQDQDGDFSGAGEPVSNNHDFKTPANLVIADGTPERKFVRRLCERYNAQAIDAWLKNTNQGFYFIEYAWRKNTLLKRGEFSPDFFIKVGNTILVVEIKEDAEIAAPLAENCEKSKYAVAHFQRLNKLLVEEKITLKYQVNFLTPSDYNKFFQLLRENKLDGFRSELDVALKNAITAAEREAAKQKGRKIA
jgi:type III restriction enzyme